MEVIKISLIALCTLLVIHTPSTQGAIGLNEFLTPPAPPSLPKFAPLPAHHSSMRQQRHQHYNHPQFNNNQQYKHIPQYNNQQFKDQQSEQPSFMQRITQWFFPSSESGGTAGPSHGQQHISPHGQQHGQQTGQQHITTHGQQHQSAPVTTPVHPAYEAQSSQHVQQTSVLYRRGHSVQSPQTHKECNPCDKVPWTPILKSQIAGYDRNVANGYNQHSQHGQHDQHGQNNHQQYQQSYRNTAEYSAPPAPGNQNHYSTLHNQGGFSHVTSKEYLPPPDVLPLENSHHHHAIPLAGRPIALPNLSPQALPPLYNAIPFKHGNGHQTFGDHYASQSAIHAPQISGSSHYSNPYEPPVMISQHGSHIDDDDIQVIPSVPVAEFVSSVEYPINVVQSPVIDIDNLAGHLPSQIEDSGFKPIEIEHEAPPHHDSHAAASNFNISIEHEKLEQIGTLPNYDSFGNKLEIYDDVSTTTTSKPYFVTNVPSSPTVVPSVQTFNNHAYNTEETYSTVGYNHQNEYSNINVNYNNPINQNEYNNGNNHQQTNNNGNFNHAISTNTEDVRNQENINHGSFETHSQTDVTQTKTGHNDDSPIMYLSINPPQKSFKGFRDINYRGRTVFTPSSLDFSTHSNIHEVSTSMQPPSPAAHVPWENIYKQQDHVDLFPPAAPNREVTPTKKPKQIQIVIPYTANSKPSLFINPEIALNQARKVTNNGKQNLFLYGNQFPPSHNGEELDFHDQEESKIVTATAQTQKPTTLKTIVLPKIHDLLKITKDNKKETLKNIKESDPKFQINIKNHKNYTSDEEKVLKNFKSKNGSKDYHGEMIKLQKNIDGWTEQEYSKETVQYKASTVSLKQSKKIPHEYLTTVAIDEAEGTTEPSSTSEFSVENELNQNITVVGQIDNNLYESNVQIGGSSESGHQTWKKIELSVSPVTKERVYVVTPMPWSSKKAYDWPQLKPSGFVLPKQTPKNTTVTAESKNATKTSLPESVNNLALGSSVEPQRGSSTTPGDKIPLRQTEVRAYTPPQGSSIETIVGHSKVVTVTTQATTKKKQAEVKN